MRIWISNTAEDQVWQGAALNADSFDFSTNTDSSFRVKIEGRLLDDDDELGEAKDAGEGEKMDTDVSAENKSKEAAANEAPRQRFSHFFKAMTVEFDRTKMRNGGDASVEWKKPDRVPNAAQPPPVADFDELTFKRNGDENQNITINLVRDETPERFELSPDLSDIVDLSVGTRAEVVMGLWEYIKAMGLQEEEEKRHFHCDEALRRVCDHSFGVIGSVALTILVRSFQGTQVSSQNSRTTSLPTSDRFLQSSLRTQSVSTRHSTRTPNRQFTTFKCQSTTRCKHAWRSSCRTHSMGQCYSKSRVWTSNWR